MAGGAAPIPQNRAIPTWTPGAKDLVMTALGGSRVWTTMSHGIFNEIYWPAVDQPQVKDFGFLIGGAGWWREVKRVNRFTMSAPDPAVALPTIVHTGTEAGQAYELTLRPVVDPDHDAVLCAYDLDGGGVRLYPLLAPHLGVSQFTEQSQWQRLGADNHARVDAAGQAMCASGGGRYLCLLAEPGFTRAGAGYVGDSDGWSDFNRNRQMTLTYSEAGPGVIALTGELAAGSGLLALGFGDNQDAARAAAQASLDAGYDATSMKFSQGWQTWTAGLALPKPARARPGWRMRCGSQRPCCALTLTTARPAPTSLAWRFPGATTPTTLAATTWCGAGMAGRPRSPLPPPGIPTTLRPRSAIWPESKTADGSWPRCFFVAGSRSIRMRRSSSTRSPSRSCSRASSMSSACPSPAAATTRSARRHVTSLSTARV